MDLDTIQQVLNEEGHDGILDLIINAYSDGFKAGKLSQREQQRGIRRKL